VAEPIFHLCTIDAWNHAQLAGSYQADSLHTEGFIHCSTNEQWPHVRRARFAGRDDLVLLAIDPELLRWPVVWEPGGEGNQVFPHVYGPLNLDAVISVQILPT